MARKPSKRKLIREISVKQTAQLDINERFLLHMRTTRKLMGLIRRCNELREAGKLAQARKLFRQCEELNEKLLELEDIGARMH